MYLNIKTMRLVNFFVGSGVFENVICKWEVLQKELQFAKGVYDKNDETFFSKGVGAPRDF